MSPETLNAICEGLVIGRSLRAMLEETGVSNGSFYRFIEADAVSAEQYARAREAQADHDADEVTAIAQKVIKGEIPADAGRVAIDACKWSAGKRKPKAYGDRIQHANDDKNPLTPAVVTDPQERAKALAALIVPLLKAQQQA